MNAKDHIRKTILIPPNIYEEVTEHYQEGVEKAAYRTEMQAIIFLLKAGIEAQKDRRRVEL